MDGKTLQTADCRPRVNKMQTEGEMLTADCIFHCNRFLSIVDFLCSIFRMFLFLYLDVFLWETCKLAYGLSVSPCK